MQNKMKRQANFTLTLLTMSIPIPMISNSKANYFQFSSVKTCHFCFKTYDTSAVKTTIQSTIENGNKYNNIYALQKVQISNKRTF